MSDVAIPPEMRPEEMRAEVAQIIKGRSPPAPHHSAYTGAWPSCRFA